jgi:hypothetical protein
MKRTTLRKLVKQYILFGYGKRCGTYAKGCSCCKAWKSFDCIFDFYYKNKDGYEFSKKWWNKKIKKV